MRVATHTKYRDAKWIYYPNGDRVCRDFKGFWWLYATHWAGYYINNGHVDLITKDKREMRARIAFRRKVKAPSRARR